MVKQVFVSCKDVSESRGDVSRPKKTHLIKSAKLESELIQDFWSAPLEARFGEVAIAAVTHRTVKTLQCDRWRKCGIPFSKVEGRVLYKKEHVVAWLESFNVVTSTSQYKSKEVDHVS